VLKIDHIGLWVRDLERMRAFYEKYFAVQSNKMYHNQKTGFRSYFLTFENGARLELMHNSNISGSQENTFGYAHLAISVGSTEGVDSMTERLVKDGYPLINGPRWTGDGYYEALFKDTEGNLVEITK